MEDEDDGSDSASADEEPLAKQAEQQSRSMGRLFGISAEVFQQTPAILLEKLFASMISANLNPGRSRHMGVVDHVSSLLDSQPQFSLPAPVKHFLEDLVARLQGGSVVGSEEVKSMAGAFS